MFYYVSGTVAHLAPYLAVIDCGGVGYACKTTNVTLSALKVGQAGKLYTYLNVREDAMELYGFATEEELNCFRMLIGVSGVGPKLALAILSGLTVGDLQLAIADGNAKRLAAVKGIGKKTAERIVVELRDKVNPIEALANGKAAEGNDAKAGILRDAMLALAALGFSDDTARLQVQRVLEEDPSVSSTETIIRRALAAK